MEAVDQAKTLVATAHGKPVAVGAKWPGSRRRINSSTPLGANSLVRSRAAEALPTSLSLGKFLSRITPLTLLERRPRPPGSGAATDSRQCQGGSRLALRSSRASISPAPADIRLRTCFGIATRTGVSLWHDWCGGSHRIFTAGRLSGNYKTAKAQHEELLISYQKAINGAFHDVSNALVGYQKTKEYTASINLLAVTLRDQTMLANARYVGGVSSYLEVLDTERQRLTAEQELTQAHEARCPDVPGAVV